MIRETLAIGLVTAFLAGTIGHPRGPAPAPVVRKAAQPIRSTGQLLRMTATAYCRGGRTASGVRARDGVVAADPRVIPIGSVVRISSRDRTRWGVFRAMDVGGRIRGRRVDIYTPNCSTARRFGRRAVWVHL